MPLFPRLRTAVIRCEDFLILAVLVRDYFKRCPDTITGFDHKLIRAVLIQVQGSREVSEKRFLRTCGLIDIERLEAAVFFEEDTPGMGSDRRVWMAVIEQPKLAQPISDQGLDRCSVDKPLCRVRRPIVEQLFCGLVASR